MNEKRAKKLLLVTLVSSGVLVGADEAIAGKTLPDPAPFIALWVVYFILSLIAEAGPSAAHAAALFSGLVLLAVAVGRPSVITKGLIGLYSKGGVSE